MQLYILGPIDHTHSAAAQLLNDVVVRNGLPDHRLEILGPQLPELLRTATELDAFTGLRRGQLIGLQWADVDFENLVIHVRRSVVMMVQVTPKTEASAKDVPLDAALAESLLKLRLTSPYNRETDWVFASPTMKGKLQYRKTFAPFTTPMSAIATHLRLPRPQWKYGTDHRKRAPGQF